MPAQPVLPAGGLPPDRSALGWLILLPLGCLALGQGLLASSGVMPVFDGTLADPDSYMRLNRVLELFNGGSWFDSREPRINPPEGHVQHWTRLLDLLLLAGAWLLQPLVGFTAGLHIWGVLFSPICLALAVIALNWAADPILDRDARLFACLAFLLQPTIMAYSSLGRSDHHSLLLLLFVVLLGLTLRLLRDPLDHSGAAAAGIVAGLSLWISPEALVFIACSLAALTWFWWRGEAGLSHKNRTYLICLAGTLAVALVVERGPAAFATVENDRLSILHVALFGAIALFWAIASAFEPLDRPWRVRANQVLQHRVQGFAQPPAPRPAWIGLTGRALLGGLGLGALAYAMLNLFPDLRDGPLGQVDPLYARLRLERIVEVQPLVPLGWLTAGEFGKAATRLVQLVGIALPALPFLVFHLLRRPDASRRLWLSVALALAVFLLLAFYQVRWSSYAQTLLVLPYSAFVAWLMVRLAGPGQRRSAQLVRPLIIVAALFWPLLLGQALPQPKIETADQGCPIERLAPIIDHVAGGTGGTILAMADYGPELLYRTNHRVLSIPNHRPQAGFAFTYFVLTDSDDLRARTGLLEHEVDWILLCPNVVERSIFAPDHGPPNTLYQRLVDGRAPSWVRPVTLTKDLAADVRLYRVLRRSKRASRGAPSSDAP